MLEPCELKLSLCNLDCIGKSGDGCLEIIAFFDPVPCCSRLEAEIDECFRRQFAAWIFLLHLVGEGTCLLPVARLGISERELIISFFFFRSGQRDGIESSLSLRHSFQCRQYGGL